MAQAPWRKGKFPDYIAFVVELFVRKDQKTGAIRSLHRLQDQNDEKAANALGPTSGMEEASWALLMESAGLEARLQILHRLTNTPHFEEKLMKADNAPDDLREMVTEDTLKVLQAALEKQVPGIVDSTIEKIRDGLRSQNG